MVSAPEDVDIMDGLEFNPVPDVAFCGRAFVRMACEPLIITMD